MHQSLLIARQFSQKRDISYSQSAQNISYFHSDQDISYFHLAQFFFKFIWLYWWLANSYKRSRHFLFSLSPKKIHFLFSLSPKDTCLIVFTWPTEHQSLLIVVAGQIHKRSGHILFSCSNYEENKVWIIFYENLNLKMIERAIEQKRGLRFYLHLIHNELGRGGAET